MTSRLITSHRGNVLVDRAPLTGEPGEGRGPISIQNDDGSVTLVHSLAEAAEVFGAGSDAYFWARRHFEGPRPNVCWDCGCAVDPGLNYWCEACRARARRFEALEIAFGTVGRLLHLVEEHALALYETDGLSIHTPDDWRELAFHALGVLHERARELLPFDHDGGDW